MKRKTIFQKIMFLSLGLIMMGALIAPSLFSKASAINNHDYSFGESSISLNSKDLLNKLLDNPNQYEIDYAENLTYEVKYSVNPNKSNVATAVLDGKLYAYAYEFTATAENGSEVTWIPKSVSFENYSYNFSKIGDKYRADIPSFSSLENSMEITYSMHLKVDKDIANEIINGAFEKGKLEAQKMDDDEDLYDAALDNYNQYLTDLENYNINQSLWNKYDVDEENYNNYLVAKQDYDQKYAAYIENKNAWDFYNEMYPKWVKYQNDLAYYNEHHEENQAAYDNFYPNYMKFEYRLNVMNLIYKPMAPMNRVIYDQIMGDSVTQVLNRKADLVALGVDESIIDDAYDATLQLRILFSDYKRYEKDTDKYNYYYNYYTTIKANVEKLLRCLDKLYRSTFVPEAISSQGKDKTEKYLNLVAQLAYLANAISDKEVYNYEAWNGISGNMNKPGAKIIDDNWQFIGKTWREYLVGEEFLDVNSSTLKAYPAESKFPSEVVVLIPEPEYVAEPTKPTTTIVEPIEPVEVLEPVAPSEKLDKPNKVEEPNYNDYVTPTLYGLAYKNGELIEHEVFIEDATIEVNCKAEITPNSVQKKLCRFLQYDGSFIDDMLFDNHPSFIGSTPYREQDAEFNDYLFIGWSKDSQIVDLENVNDSIELKAAFQGRNLDKFTITYVIGDQNIDILCPVGELPILPSNISLPETNEHFYEFVSWDKELVIVNKAVTYTAIFQEKNKYEIRFNIDGNETIQYCKEGYLPEIPSQIDKPDTDNYYYVFLGWDKEIEVTTEPCTYTALFEEKAFILVTWNIDGNKQIEKYKIGDEVTYKGIIPIKDSDNVYYYNFNNWSVNLPFNAEKNIEINALFDKFNFVYVTYYLQDRTVSYKYLQGETIIEPIVDEYFDDCYIYSFSNFKKLPESSINNIYYRAIYNQEYILKYNNAGVYVHAHEGVISIYLNDNPNSFDLKPLFDLFNKGYELNPIEIVGKSYTISISKAQLRLLLDKDFASLSYNVENLGHKQYKYSISLFDSFNNPLENIENINISLVQQGDFDELRSFIYLNDARVTGTISSKTCSFALKPNEIYSIYPTYKITLLQSDNATIQLDKESAIFGEKIVLKYILSPGYNFNGFTINDTKGNYCNTFSEYVMQDADITVGISLTKQEYLITFIVDGNIFAISYVPYGNEIIPPTNVFKDSTEDNRYIFIGWDKSIGVATQNEEFHAIFEEIPIEKPVIQNKVSVITVVKWVGFSALGAGLLVALFIVLKKFVLKKH